MKKLILALSLFLAVPKAKADLWGGDIPLLIQIVANTLQTLMQLQEQTQLLEDSMDGINDQINRIRTISDLIRPDDWEGWKDPKTALERLKSIYYTLPKEYRNEKAEVIERELSRAMNMIAQISNEAQTTFKSGKELEQRGKDVSPGVAQKLTASGVGTLISMEAQTQVIQSHIVSLMSQMIAEANDKESRAIVSKGSMFQNISENIGKDDGKFSTKIMPLRSSE